MKSFQFSKKKSKRNHGKRSSKASEAGIGKEDWEFLFGF
jgi:hypothetical protein